MFLIIFLSQPCKFAGPFLLPVYRVCIKIMVINFLVTLYAFFQKEFFAQHHWKEEFKTVLLSC